MGLNALNSKDPDGKPIIKDRMALAKVHAKGWQDVKYKNPKSGVAEPKAMYYELHDGLVFATGIYKEGLRRAGLPDKRWPPGQRFSLGRPHRPAGSSIQRCAAAAARIANPRARLKPERPVA